MDPAAHLIIVPVVLPLLAAALQLVIERRWPRAQMPITLTVTLALAFVAGALLRRADSGAVDVYLLGNWRAPFGIALALDRLAALLLALTAGVAVVAAMYSATGWARRGAHFHAFFLFQIAGLNGAFLTADLFNLFVFFEVLLIASYALLLHGAGGRALRSGYHYVVINLVGSSLFLIAASLFYGLTGTLNFADLAQRIAAAPVADRELLGVAGMLLLVVFALKAAILPLGFWLPDTYRAAPAPVAVLFAVMTKVGVYAIVRVTTLLFGAGGGVLAGLGAGPLYVLGAGTVVLGSLGALSADRFRGLVASLIVVSAGTLVAAIATGAQPVLAGALYYLVHSTLAAAILFLLADPIARQRGADGDRLRSGARMADATLVGLLTLFGAMAIAGLPPLSGFIGKVGILEASRGLPEAASLWTLLLAAGLVAMIALARAGSRVFWKIRPGAALPTPATAGRIVPVEGIAIGVMALALLALVVFAVPVQRYMRDTAQQLHAPAAYVGRVLGELPVTRGVRPAPERTR
jgi:multicomponent K+:H+ antiporter subunit D